LRTCFRPGHFLFLHPFSYLVISQVK
jgi:hypothetical protein